LSPPLPCTRSFHWFLFFVYYSDSFLLVQLIHSGVALVSSSPTSGRRWSPPPPLLLHNPQLLFSSGPSEPPSFCTDRWSRRNQRPNFLIKTPPSFAPNPIPPTISSMTRSRKSTLSLASTHDAGPPFSLLTNGTQPNRLPP